MSTPFKMTKIRHLRVQSPKGDETLAEWDVDTVSESRLAEIEAEFNQRLATGYFAANLNTNEIIQEFDPNAEILFMRRIMGGVEQLGVV